MSHVVYNFPSPSWGQERFAISPPCRDKAVQNHWLSVAMAIITIVALTLALLSTFDVLNLGVGTYALYGVAGLTALTLIVKNLVRCYMISHRDPNPNNGDEIDPSIFNEGGDNDDEGGDDPLHDSSRPNVVRNPKPSAENHRVNSATTEQIRFKVTTFANQKNADGEIAFSTAGRIKWVKEVNRILYEDVFLVNPADYLIQYGKQSVANNDDEAARRVEEIRRDAVIEFFVENLPFSLGLKSIPELADYLKKKS